MARGNNPARQLEGRDGEIWRRSTVYRWTQERIAQHFGLSQQRVASILAEIRKELKPLVMEDMVRNSMEFLDEVQARAFEIADLAGAPIAVGKDGMPLIDPDTGETVRDYGGRIRALELAMKADAEVRKMHGLNAPEKKQISGELRYEVVGVEDADLT